MNGHVPRTAFWGDCESCPAVLIIHAHIDSDEDLPGEGSWERGFVRTCPVCDGTMNFSGTDDADRMGL